MRKDCAKVLGLSNWMQVPFSELGPHLGPSPWHQHLGCRERSESPSFSNLHTLTRVFPRPDTSPLEAVAASALLRI